MLPCLGCRHGVRAREEIVVDYLNFLRFERRLRDDDRPIGYLPRHCCKQTKAVAGLTYLRSTPLGTALRFSFG